ncbi:hypothetical protein PIB30_027568 [Stylosanthes scabra]|uniref:Uncharacterized protein n=1 Tax=Stylosanthes scabra TaxID=79078 RepID=A0ABU6W8P7_9FABA|nr:hypothetical protein [Stylosanthes scabra]
MKARHQVKADRRKESGRFFSTKPYWPKGTKKDIFRVKLTKDKKHRFNISIYFKKASHSKQGNWHQYMPAEFTQTMAKA